MRHVFCHGIPGSVKDAALLGAAHTAIDCDALDLFDIGSDPSAHLRAMTFGEPVLLIGFSIGAMTALRLAAECPDIVARVTLVSAAAPLSIGRFLPHMAGRPVFQMARFAPILLRGLTWWQGRMLGFAPDRIVGMLTATCGPDERALLTSGDGAPVLRAALETSFVDHPADYIRLIRGYVTDWADVLPRVACPVDLWHGTNDTWAPFTMAQSLCEALGPRATLHPIEGSEHYTTLTQVRLTSE